MGVAKMIKGDLYEFDNFSLNVPLDIIDSKHSRLIRVRLLGLKFLVAREFTRLFGEKIGCDKVHTFFEALPEGSVYPSLHVFVKKGNSTYFMEAKSCKPFIKSFKFIFEMFTEMEIKILKQIRAFNMDNLAKEMTIEAISKELGYDVKVVKEETS